MASLSVFTLFLFLRPYLLDALYNLPISQWVKREKGDTEAPKLAGMVAAKFVTKVKEL